MENNKKPDRLNCSRRAKELIDRIDESNFMLLGRSITRSELFSFALSLGIETGIMTPIDNIYQGGLILEKSIDIRTKTLIYSQFIYSFKDIDENLDSITNKSLVFNMAEQYANTGFSIIADYFDNSKEQDLMLELFVELDEKFEKLDINKENINNT